MQSEAYEKIAMEMKKQRLDLMEESRVEDWLVESFIENEVMISAVVARFKDETILMKEPIERVIHLEKCVPKIVDIINNRWGGREKNEVDTLARLCISRCNWYLSDIEIEARNQAKKEEMLARNTTLKK